MSKNLICYEQGILTLMLAEHPEWFEIVFCDGKEMQMIFNGSHAEIG